MKKLFAFALTCILSVFVSHGQVLKKIGDKVKNKAEQRADQKVDQTIDKGLDKTEEGMKGGSKGTKEEKSPEDPAITKATKDTTIAPGNPGITTSLKVYQNYDFVPGDKILFEDHFINDQDGEFATHWELKGGQAILNKVDGSLAMHLTEGNYARVIPRMKSTRYLSDPYTIEFDWYHLPGAYGVELLLGFINKDGYESEAHISIQPSEISFTSGVANVKLGKDYPTEIHNSIDNKWHHVAIAFKNRQVKIYLDQSRILVVPDTKEDYDNITFAGIGSEEVPVIFKNIRLASGGNMNMIGKKFTHTKIITHGINFDINKALIKPESMGTLNMIVQVLKDNPDIRFEIGGHTDTDGAADYNLKLSQQRADAVKEQLIKMGIDASRLSAKGYGETKPISDNNSLEGKANNRRVEFVVQK
jgi:OmpA-OmpF porin, OOP family